MNRIRCTVSYDGTHFAGYQIQPNQRTVQGELEHVLTIMHKGDPIKVYGSGRTDAGVHAVGQVLHFDSNLSIDSGGWYKALNAQLPKDIQVTDVSIEPESFHARFDVLKKEYQYKILNRPTPDVFKRNYAYHYPFDLDVERMKEAATYLKGTHDFTSFSSMKTTVEDKVRTIYALDIFKKGDELTVTVVGNGFLYNMVRIIVGTLIDVGSGKLPPHAIQTILNNTDRSTAGKTAPGHGLYLWKVLYDSNIDK